MSISSDVCLAVPVFADFSESDLAQLSTTTSIQTVQLSGGGNATLTPPDSVDGKSFLVRVAGYAHVTSANQANIYLAIGGTQYHSVLPVNSGGTNNLSFLLEMKCYWNSTTQKLLNYGVQYGEGATWNFDPNPGNTPINTNTYASASSITFTIQASLNNTDASSYVQITEFRIQE